MTAVLGRWYFLFTYQWENSGDGADQVIGKTNVKHIRSVLVRRWEGICIKDMKLWGGRKLSKEKYVKVLRIDACIIARYSLKSLNQRKLFTPSVRKAAGLLGDDHSLLLDTLPFKKFIHLCIMQTKKKTLHESNLLLMWKEKNKYTGSSRSKACLWLLG